MRLSATAVGVFVLALSALIPAAADERPLRIGPQSESSFPPLKLADGFQAKLFACDPLIEFPSVIAIGPRPNTLFVANDYVKGMGTQINRRDDIRLLEDSDDDGYADRAPVFADDFGSIQGLEYFSGSLYVMHAPRLTVLKDVDGDGVADERRDLLDGLGLPPEQNPSRLHCANGIVAGHDGWMYLALGDNGCNVLRPEGDRLIVEGGAILRCRTDGTSLHVFATGIRNVYDIALDDQLNVFFRDNENDGGDYMVRICASFFSADHGYPYLYRDRPFEALPPLVDLGRGSSAGGVCYRETQFPPEWRGNLFFCEWGRAVMQCRTHPEGAGFANTTEHEFASGDANDPYGFKPTDIVVLRDGSMMISDWADEQSTGRGRARIYHISFNSSDMTRGSADRAFEQRTIQHSMAALDSESYYDRIEAQQVLLASGKPAIAALTRAWNEARLGARARGHGVWIRVLLEGVDSLPWLLELLAHDPDANVRLQAIRAIGDLTDPTLSQGWLKAGAGDQELAERLSRLYEGQSPHVRREIIITLSRLKWYDAPSWLASTLHDPDPFLAHAAMQCMRRSENWNGVLGLLGANHDASIRPIAIRALAEQYQPVIVDHLVELLADPSNAERTQEYADLLSRVHRRPGAWTYWGYRPGPRPVNTEEWSHTARIQRALNHTLENCDERTCVFLLQRMDREKIPTSLSALTKWLTTTRDPELVAALLSALQEHLPSDTRKALVQFIGRQSVAVELRQRALTMLTDDLPMSESNLLLELATDIEDGPLMADLVSRIADGPDPNKAIELCLVKLDSARPEVRAASLDALAKLGATQAATQIMNRLQDADASVQRAAVRASGTLEIAAAAPGIDELIREGNSALRADGLRALMLLNDARAMDVAAQLSALDSNTELAALEYLAKVGDPSFHQVITETALQRPTQPILQLAITTLSKWAEQHPEQRRELSDSIAKIQGKHGVLLSWHVVGPLTTEQLRAWLQQTESSPAAAALMADVRDGVLLKARESDEQWLASTAVYFSAETTIQFQISSGQSLRIFLNGKECHEHGGAGAKGIVSSFDVQLPVGRSGLAVLVTAQQGDNRYRIELRQTAENNEHEKLIRLALEQTGNAENGRTLFANVERVQCAKCHRIGDQGERIAPELTDIGSRFSRIHLIEAILTPSRSVGAGYQTYSFVLTDGRIMTGLQVAKDEQSITIADQHGQQHRLAVEEIDEQIALSTSIMPDGLEKQLSPSEFVDLIEFLTQQVGK